VVTGTDNASNTEVRKMEYEGTMADK